MKAREAASHNDFYKILALLFDNCKRNGEKQKWATKPQKVTTQFLYLTPQQGKPVLSTLFELSVIQNHGSTCTKYVSFSPI